MNLSIAAIDAYPIYDSRGQPTIEVEVVLGNGACGLGRVPSGASTGQFEALELRDGDPGDHRGRSVWRAVEHVRGEIAAAMRGHDAGQQRAIDAALIALDGTADKHRLGANAVLGVSMAVAQARANACGIWLFEALREAPASDPDAGTLLPLPEIQIIGGGAHANWRTDVQDYLVIANGARSYAESLRMTHDVYRACGDLLREAGKLYGVADEGGYWPEFETNEAPLAMLVEAIERAGYRPGDEVSLSLDLAASDLHDPEHGGYRLRLEDRRLSSAEFSDLVIDWCRRYPILSIEDPAADTDWAGWERISAALGERVQIVGDDLFTTNSARIREGIRRGVANSVLIKPNQIGTVSETLDAIALTRSAGWLPLVSARSGETEDAFISHLAVATDAGQLKVGSFSRGERMAKWNECLRIERRLGERARFLGGRLYAQLFRRADGPGRGAPTALKAAARH
jgi:enolase